MLPEVAAALAAGRPVVALESSVLAQGLPIPSNRAAAESMCRAVGRAGALAAITAVVHGQATLGLEPPELERFLAREGVRKVSSRDLGVAMAQGADGATTVAASLCIAHAAGATVFSTGGIGGVHRGAPFDESGTRTYTTGGPIGDAILLAMLTAPRLAALISCGPHLRSHSEATSGGPLKCRTTMHS